MIPVSRSYKAEVSEWFAAAAAEAKRECRACGGSGYVKVMLIDFPPGEVSRRCDCLQRVNTELLYRRGNLPRMFWGEPAGIEWDPAVVEFSRNLGERDRPASGLFLVGSYGTGKTTHACRVLRDAAAIGMTIFRIEATEVERALSLVKSRQDWVDSWLQEGMLADVVSVDEMGVETVRGTCGREARSALSYYVKHRYEQGLPTVLCTNLEDEEFTEHYGGAIASVVLGSGYVKLSFQGQDRRG